MLSRRVGSAAVAAAALAATLWLAPASAEAHGRGRGGFHGAVVVGGYYGYPYWGFYDPFYTPFFWGGPYAYAPEGGVDMGAAMIAGYGALDMNVKPGSAEVWVDGKYVAEARDLDGYPSFLWLPEGTHKLEVYKGGYALFSENVEVRRGFKSDLKIRLEKGEAQPPGKKPGNAE